MNTVEIDQIDTRFEGTRLKDKVQEGFLLTSILESGIREPLLCIITPEDRIILLDGFKRYRIARKIGMGSLPCTALDESEVGGILQILRVSNNKSLNILEQAALVDELHVTYGLSSPEIAVRLEKSPAWVSVRLGILSEMSEFVRTEVFAGRFPARSYMYVLRPLTRVNKATKPEIDDFVSSVTGKNLSGRDLERLAYGYFHGGSDFKEQLKDGNISWTLDRLRRCDAGVLHGEPQAGLSELEQRLIRDLEITRKYMGRVVYGIPDLRLRTDAFFLQAHLLVEGILEKLFSFSAVLKCFLSRSHERITPKGAPHDQSGEEKGRVYTLSGRKRQKRDCPASKTGS